VVAANEYGMLDGEIPMFCIRVKCMQMRSTYIHKGCVIDVPHSWLDHFDISLVHIWNRRSTSLKFGILSWSTK
jgi:hypothetical protein